MIDNENKKPINLTIIDFEDSADAFKLIKKGAVILKKNYIPCKVQLERSEIN